MSCHCDCSSKAFAPIQPEVWSLDPKVTFLNHGSFGSCPKPILERQQQLRAELERQPVAFLVGRLTPLLDESRNILSDLIGADPADMVFVHNATVGVNSVLRSLEFKPGDEILCTVHDYNACRNVARYVAQRSGAKIVEVNVPLPVACRQQVVDAVLAKVTPRTRLAMLDHITSPTALVFPIEDLVRELNQRGVDTLVDGAHTAGMLPLDLNTLGAAYYTGNCHKWLCTPKGAGFLWVRRDRQEGIQPATISHGYNKPRRGYSPFQDGFDWPGTWDPTPWICVGDSIQFISKLLPGGLPALMKRNHDLAMLGRKILCERLGLTPIGNEEMLGSMAAVILPDEIGRRHSMGQMAGDANNGLHDQLLAEFNIEVPVMCWPAPPQMVLRFSAQAYNYPAQYERLADAVSRLK